MVFGQVWTIGAARRRGENLKPNGIESVPIDVTFRSATAASIELLVRLPSIGQVAEPGLRDLFEQEEERVKERETPVVQLVGVAVLIGSGLISGVFFAVAVSVLPALNAMTPDRYLQAHSLLGKGYHPTMPLLVNATLVADIVLAVAAPSATIRSLLITSIVGIVVVEAVSHLCNVPLNNVVRGTDADALPANWQDPRPRWRRWHMIRTVAALVVLLLNSLAITLAN